VALKILSRRLDSPDARRRFLKEGRLAASINHPNSVYVFGTEEIAGVPVIAMELMPGGTLEETVREHGPMPAMIAAVVAGDGLIMRATGVSVVDRYGRPADRALASRRSLIAWLPTLASPAIYASIYVWKGPDGAGIGTLAALGLIAGLSALLPHRSLHDRLAGTWLVPR